MHNSLSIDEIIDASHKVCEQFAGEQLFVKERQQLQSLKSRLYRGEIHIAIIGQFNRGKSTFINKLLQTELLPASVLPLTSLSTQILYRAHTGYTITFQDGSTLDEEASEEEIQKVLIDYVAESSNPMNHKGVRNVKVGCPNTLLQHGTRIIDTPGFGSTHIHNTKATLELLKECDAVLFMLSADLPITQIELNFLKRILPHVTRLFFIYNKKDLLNPTELDETTHFIQETLRNQLQIESRDNFFTISARDADSDREAAGITKIEENILGFLQREKYFSLAEAIDKKLKDTLSSIRETFHTKTDELESKEVRILEEIDQAETILNSMQESQHANEEDIQNSLEALEESIYSTTPFSFTELTSELTKIFYNIIEQGKIKSFNDLIPRLQSEVSLLFVTNCQQVSSDIGAKLPSCTEEIFIKHKIQYVPTFYMQSNPKELPLFFTEQKEGLTLFQSSKQRQSSIEKIFKKQLPQAAETFITGLKNACSLAFKEICNSYLSLLQNHYRQEREKLQSSIDKKRALTLESKNSLGHYKQAQEELPRL